MQKKLQKMSHTMIENVKLVELNRSIATVVSNMKTLKMNHQRKFYEILKERFLNTYKFSNHDNNKFILLVRKGDKLFVHIWMIRKIL